MPYNSIKIFTADETWQFPSNAVGLAKVQIIGAGGYGLPSRGGGGGGYSGAFFTPSIATDYTATGFGGDSIGFSDPFVQLASAQNGNLNGQGVGGSPGDGSFGFSGGDGGDNGGGGGAAGPTNSGQAGFNGFGDIPGPGDHHGLGGSSEENADPKTDLTEGIGSIRIYAGNGGNRLAFETSQSGEEFGGGGGGEGGNGSGAGAPGVIVVLYNIANTVRIFTGDETFQFPADAGFAVARAIGAGGSGNPDNGGGGGAYAQRTFTPDPEIIYGAIFNSDAVGVALGTDGLNDKGELLVIADFGKDNGGEGIELLSLGDLVRAGGEGDFVTAGGGGGAAGPLGPGGNSTSLVGGVAEAGLGPTDLTSGIGDTRVYAGSGGQGSGDDTDGQPGNNYGGGGGGGGNLLDGGTGIGGANAGGVLVLLYYTAPEAPTNLRAYTLDATHVLVTWTSNATFGVDGGTTIIHFGTSDPANQDGPGFPAADSSGIIDLADWGSPDASALLFVAAAFDIASSLQGGWTAPVHSRPTRRVARVFTEDATWQFPGDAVYAAAKVVSAGGGPVTIDEENFGGGGGGYSHGVFVPLIGQDYSIVVVGDSTQISTDEPVVAASRSVDGEGGSATSGTATSVFSYQGGHGGGNNGSGGGAAGPQGNGADGESGILMPGGLSDGDTGSGTSDLTEGLGAVRVYCGNGGASGQHLLTVGEPGGLYGGGGGSAGDVLEDGGQPGGAVVVLIYYVPASVTSGLRGREMNRLGAGPLRGRPL